MVTNVLAAQYCIGVNYKSLSFAKELQDAAPDGVNIYFDCVGGDILDAVLPVMALHGRIAACGSISGYNGANALRLNNWFQVITMRLRIQGFIVLDYYAKAHEARSVLRQAIVDGKLHLDAESETVCPANFEDIPEVWLKLFEGGNQGKLVTHLQ
jgi:NADPH-dependent curcumin reductase CurA